VGSKPEGEAYKLTAKGAKEGENPNGLKFSFQLLDGAKFMNIQEA